MNAFAPITIFFEPAADSVFVSYTALALAVAAGLVLRRWKDGVVASTVIVVGAHALLLVAPTVAAGRSFPLEALTYALFWIPFVLFCAQLLIAFGLTFGLRTLIWRRMRRARGAH